MNTTKLKKATLITASAVLAASLVGVCATTLHASAATYKPENIFRTETNASVKADGSFVEFSFEGNTKNAVSFNRDLAYQWYTAVDTAEYFSTEFSFGTVAFETFTVTLQSAENSKSAEGVTQNQVVFFNESGSYSVAVRNNDDRDKEDDELTKTSVASLSGDVKIALGADADSGEYAVTVSVGGTTVVTDTFTNIRGAYAEYTASKIIPLSFTAAMPAQSTDKQTVSLKSINGQSFALTNGQITDNAHPVLVVDDDVKSFILGIKLMDLSYDVIDVLDTSVTKTVQYYQYNPADAAANREYEDLKSDTIIKHKYTYSESNPEEYVSVKIGVKDDTMTEAKDYMLEWYCTDRDTTSGMIKVIFDNQAPAFVASEVAAYQTAVTEAAEDMPAGSGYSFYLPSLEDLIQDANSSYTSLSFTIYYRTNNNDSATAARKFDNLSIPVSTTGEYRFKVVASDKQGNTAKYNYNGDMVEPNENNVWKIDEIPYFTFRVENKGLEIEDVKKLDEAFIYSEFTVADFTIKGLIEDRQYQLYYLDGISAAQLSYDKIIEIANQNLDDDAFKAKLIEESGVAANSVTLRAINEYNGKGPTDDGDEGWAEHDNRYNWRSTTMKLTPQESGYYIVRVKAIDEDAISTVYSYQVIYAESEVDVNVGETYWLENNVTTVVFIVIAAVAAIALLAVWIFMPSKETAEEGETKNSAGALSERRKKR
ncbi:MAG: hypothetical protein IKC91_01155 [Clostridia bacterium]|nr:hypothetical protein [Clostridia bacterium]